MRTALVAAIAVALVVLTMAFRVLAMGGPLGGFENDQFVTLSEAQQVVIGDWPVRDFSELGKPLTVGISAAGQVLFGRTLLTEALLTSMLLGVCAAVLFLLSWRASGSIPIALLVALVQVAMAPRFYNYPKLLAYAVAIPALWWYIDRPSRRRLMLVAFAGAFAFLLRHDHGVYVGVAAVMAIALVHRPDVRRIAETAALLGAATFAMALPYLVFVQMHGGVMPYMSSFARYAEQTADRTTSHNTAFSFDWSRPLAVRAAPLPPQPRINVRWTSGLTDGQRTDRERALGLIEPERRSADVVNYRLTDASSARLAAIVHDPAVADTEGVDRQAFVLNDPDFTRVPTAWERTLASMRSVRILPGVLRGDNAVPFLYWLCWAVAIAAALIVLYRGDAASPTPWHRSGAKIAVVAVLGLVIDRSFLRGNLPSRLADVSEVVGVLSAWVAASALSRAAGKGRAAVTSALVLILILTCASVEALEGVYAQLMQTGIVTGRALARATGVHELLSATPPVDAWPDDAPGMEGLARYVHACTRPGDRVLTLGYLPELFFMSQRPFAGGSVWIQPNFFETDADQQLMIERTIRYRVPIVITVPEPEYTAEYVRGFPRLTTMLRADYREVETADFGRGFRFRVLARTSITPTSTYQFGALPCFS